MSSFQSLDRAIDILFVFTKAEPRLSADDIAKKANLPRGSIYRYINALIENGLIERDSDSNKFQLGYRLLYFQSVIHHSNVLEDIAYLYMDKINKATSETVQLTEYRRNQAIPIESIESAAHVRVAPPLGTFNSLHAGANNKAILAFRTEEEVQKNIEDGLSRITSSTITDPELLIIELKEIRTKGYAFSNEEVHQGAWGVAAPIIGKEGLAIGSVGVSGPLFRLTEELKKRATEMVLQAGREISEKIQFQKNQ